MTIETKYSLGDKRWLIYENKVYQGEIVAIRSKVTNENYRQNDGRDTPYTSYTISFSERIQIFENKSQRTNQKEFIESDLEALTFNTKEELLKYISE